MPAKSEAFTIHAYTGQEFWPYAASCVLAGKGGSVPPPVLPVEPMIGLECDGARCWGSVVECWLWSPEAAVVFTNAGQRSSLAAVPVPLGRNRCCSPRTMIINDSTIGTCSGPLRRP